MSEREKLVVANGSKYIVREEGPGNWVSRGGVHPAGNLKPAVYPLYEAQQAKTDGKMAHIGTVIHADEKNVFQVGINQITRHNRKDFDKVPDIGSHSRIEYKNGRVIDQTRQQQVSNER